MALEVGRHEDTGEDTLVVAKPTHADGVDHGDGDHQREAAEALMEGRHDGRR